MKIGLFLPMMNSVNEKKSIHNSWIWRMPNGIIDSLKERLLLNNEIEIVDNINILDAYSINWEVFVWDICLSNLDLFFWYCETWRSDVNHWIEMLKILSKKTKVIPNPYNFEVALDKFKAHVELINNKISVPEILLFQESNLKNIEKKLKEWGSVILKPRLWWFGKGVTYIDNLSMLRDIICYNNTINVTKQGSSFYLERFYKNDIKKWISVTVINWEVILWYIKKDKKFIEMKKWIFKVYDENEIWWEVELWKLNNEVEQLALSAYKILWLEIIWFDIIFTWKEYLIVDENTFPWIYEDLLKVNWVDISSKLYDMIINKI